MSQKKTTVTNLIRKFNRLLNIKHHKRLSSTCTCLFRLYDNVNSICPEHFIIEENKIINLILETFIKKNIIYIHVSECNKIIYGEKIFRLLPLVIHVHHGDNGLFHLAERSSPIKLNNPRVAFANLLIINVIKCSGKKCFNYNRLLIPCKIIKFKYLIFINYKTDRPEKYIEKNDVIFIFKLANFINKKP